MMNRLYHGDCREVIPTLECLPVPCIFADPPDNIGLGYGEYADKLSDEEYFKLLERWLSLFVKTASTTWFSFNAKWTTQVGVFAERLKEEHLDLDVKVGVQTFTFGQHNKRDFGNNHRPLWRFRRHDAPVYAEQIKVPSWRQLHGDRRAAPGGRVPGDVHNFPLELMDGWMERLMKDLGLEETDVFDYPRVTGNSQQRRKWHPTQLHEDLVERCIKSSTLEGDTVCDPFAGTGTSLRVCQRINRSCITMDVDRDYCERISKETGIEIF